MNFKNVAVFAIVLLICTMGFTGFAQAQTKVTLCGSTDPLVTAACAKLAGNYAFQLTKSQNGNTLVVTGAISLDGKGNLNTSDSSVPGEVRPSRGGNNDVTLDVDKGDPSIGRNPSGAILGGSALMRFHLAAIGGQSYMIGPFMTIVPADFDAAGCNCFRKIYIVGSPDTSLVGEAYWQGQAQK